MEKLAELYSAQGKPASTIATYERALLLDPSPQQLLVEYYFLLNLPKALARLHISQ
jgi:hypothetical protein